MKKQIIFLLVLVGLFGFAVSANAGIFDWFNNMFKQEQTFSGTFCMPWQGCTGTSTNPSYGQLLVGTSAGVYQLQATSSLGISGGTYTATYPITLTGTAFGTAFGTTTSNTWAGLQTFGNATGTQLTTTGSTYLATLGGKVGIGTTSPEELLTVAGEVLVTNGGSISLKVGGQLYFDNPDYNVSIGSYATGDMRFMTGDSFEKMRITGEGNVGIGTTTPYAKLSVVGETVAAYFTATTTTASTFPYASTTALSATSLCLTGDNCIATWPVGGGGGVGWASSTDPTSIYFTGSGNIGIGTTSPYAKLSVVGEVVGSYFTATSTTASSTFNNIVPTTDSTYNLGNSNIAWFNAYIDKINNTTGNIGYMAFNNSAYSVIFWEGTTVKPVLIRSALIVAPGGSEAFRVQTAVPNVSFFTLSVTGGVSTNFFPQNDSSINSGISDRYWANTYTDKLFLNSTATLDGATAGVISIVGNVGIGTTTPGATLGVQGSVLADSYLEYSKIYQGDALISLKQIKAKIGKIGEWVDVDHQTLPEGVYQKLTNTYKQEFYEAVTKEKFIDGVTTSMPYWKHKYTKQELNEEEYNALSEDEKWEEKTYTQDVMSLSNLVKMNTRGILQLDEKLSLLEKKLGGNFGSINSQGKFDREQLKQELKQEIKAELKKEIKDEILSEFRNWSIMEKIKFIFK